MEKRMEELIKILNEAARVYYQGEDEIMDNFTYDALYDELLELEKKTGKVLPNSPSQSVGYEIISNFPKETHSSPMLSLNKTKLTDELIDFLGDKKGFLSWKLDGLTIVLHYSNGELVKAVTRGNGKVGEIVTPNAKFFNGVPLTISFNGDLVIRGEAIITYSDFNRINAERKPGTEEYRNPRNLASGTVRQLNTRTTKKRNVQYRPFQLVSFVETEEDKALNWDRNSYSGRLDFLKTLGFNPVEGVIVDTNTLKTSVSDFSNKIETNDFPSDGLVLVYDEVDYGLSLGTTSKYPRYGLAFKWKDETVETTLREIEWSPSRTGLLNPVAIFDSVDIEGTCVSRASVHNINTIEDLKLGIGDTIEVFKANMIIPQVATNLTNSGTCVIPDVCPCCGGKTKIVKNFNSSTNKEIKTLYCTNDDCPAKNIGAFEQFVSRDAFNIVGLAVSTIEKLLSAGLIKTFADIYNVKKYKDTIVLWEGMGERSYQKMIDSIETSREVDIDRFIYALGIPNIGKSTATLICKALSYDINKIMSVTKDELVNIEGVGEIIANTFVDYFADTTNINNVNALLNEVHLIIPIIKTSSISGLTFVITGTLPTMGRNEAADLIKQNGGKVSGSVSKKTDYLLYGDNAGNKLDKADALGVKKITEAEFLAMI